MTPVAGLILSAMLPIVLSPGASFALTVGHSTAREPHAAVRVAAGTAAATTIIAVLACLSPVAAVAADYPAFRTLLGITGSVVMIWLGINLLRRSLSGRTPETDPAPTRPTPAIVRQAFAATIFNPKALAVYLAVVPAIAVEAGKTLYSVGVAFAAAHVVAMFAWLGFVGWSVRHLRWFDRPLARRVLQALSAVSLSATGLVLGVAAVLQA